MSTYASILAGSLFSIYFNHGMVILRDALYSRPIFSYLHVDSSPISPRSQINHPTQTISQLPSLSADTEA